MTQVNVNELLDRINKVADNKEQIKALKIKQENDLVEEYTKQIKSMANRISDMLLIVNTLIERKLYDTDKIGIGRTFEGIHFYGGKTYEMRFKTPYKIIAYVYKTGLGSTGGAEKAVYISADGSIKHMYLNYQNDYEIDEPVSSQLLFKFIVAFEQVEKMLQTYIENL